MRENKEKYNSMQKKTHQTNYSQNEFNQGSAGKIDKIRSNALINIFKSFKFIKDLLFLSFMQIIFLGIIIFFIERLNLYFLYVETFDRIFYITELALIFFFIFLFIDFITECLLDFLNKKYFKSTKEELFHDHSLFSVIFESILQTSIFIIINTISQSLGIFGVNIRNNSNMNVSSEFFIFLVFFAILIIECITEGIEIISIKIKKKINIMKN